MEGRAMSYCQAMVLVPSQSRPEGRFTVCEVEPAELHHKLTRARGGLLLDAVGETYHHIYLCREHHSYAHDTDQGYTSGLMIRGFVTTATDGQPWYSGNDEYLLEHYGTWREGIGEVQRDAHQD